jgi:KTSC domain-containing protein
MTWVTLDSEMLSAAAYDAEKQMLYLRFRKTGDVYRYFELPKENYQEFLDTESRGRYFLNHIRHDFSYERLARLTGA